MKLYRRKMLTSLLVIVSLLLTFTNPIFAEENNNEQESSPVIETIDLNLESITSDAPFAQSTVYVDETGEEVVSNLIVEDVTELFQLMPLESGQITDVLETGSVYRFFKEYIFSDEGRMIHDVYIQKISSSQIRVISANLTVRPPQSFALTSSDLEQWVQVYDWEIRSRGYASFHYTLVGYDYHSNRYVDMSAVCSTVGNGFAVSYYFSTVPKP